MSSVWPFELDTVQNWAYWDNAFSKEECEKIISIGNSKNLSQSYVSREDDLTVQDISIKNAEIAWLYSSDNMEWAFQRLFHIINSLNTNFFRFDLFGMIEGLQFTKYQSPDGVYVKHMDKFSNSMGVVRKLSITIQLSNPLDYEGGELDLHLDSIPTTMKKDQGRLVMFPSYILHEVKPVTKGTRYSLVAWVSGKPFK